MAAALFDKIGRVYDPVWEMFAPQRDPKLVRLCRALDGSLPSKEEEMVTAKRAPVGLKQPEESSLNGITDPYASKLDRSAIGTACGNQPFGGAHHDPNRQPSPECVQQSRTDFGLTARRQDREGRCRASRRLGGSPPALPEFAPVFSSRAPTL